MRLGERGSLVVSTVFVLSIVFAGFFWYILNPLAETIQDTSEVHDTTFDFLIYFWVYGIPLLILIVSALWYFNMMQKKKMETY